MYSQIKFLAINIITELRYKKVKADISAAYRAIVKPGWHTDAFLSVMVPHQHFFKQSDVCFLTDLYLISFHIYMDMGRPRQRWRNQKHLEI
jgi:hypothetical protein